MAVAHSAIFTTVRHVATPVKPFSSSSSSSAPSTSSSSTSSSSLLRYGDNSKRLESTWNVFSFLSSSRGRGGAVYRSRLCTTEWLAGERLPSPGAVELRHHVHLASKQLIAKRKMEQNISNVRVAAVTTTGFDMPAAPIEVPEGPWKQIPGGVCAAKGFRAAGMYAGLRALGQKPDLALVICDTDAVAAGVFTLNLIAAAPVKYCKQVLAKSDVARAVLINAGQANAATGEEGWQAVLETCAAAAEVLQVASDAILVESTGVIGKQIKKTELIEALPKLANSLSSSIKSGEDAAIAITTTDLVSKSVAIEAEIGGRIVRVGGMAKGSGMIHPNMATLLSVVTCDAVVAVDVWRTLVSTAVNRSFNQITVDGDTSTNDTVIALASGAAGGSMIDDVNSKEAVELQAALDVVCTSLAKSIASDGEGATVLMEVTVSGAADDASAAKVARSVAASSLVKAAVYGRDPNWGRLACAAGYAGIDFKPDNLKISLGEHLLMDGGQPQSFDRAAASAYLKAMGDVHGTVHIDISIGSGQGEGKAWGCDLSYDYVKINAEYTT